MNMSDKRERQVSLYGERGVVENEQRVKERWFLRGKGKPIRWKMLRDVLACLSLGWMSTFQVQIAMRRLWGLKNKTTRDILEELETEKSVIQKKKDDDSPFMWGATENGVAFWILKTSNIPATIAQVAETSMSVEE